MCSVEFPGQTFASFVFSLPETVRQYIIPAEYHTAKGALYKARTLQFVVDSIALDQRAWILHCDEERQITLVALYSCLQFIQYEETLRPPGQLPAIGQGAMLYHRDFWKRPFLSMADSVRTAMDFGYFRVQPAHAPR